jgi:hypothetical protein
MSQFSNLIGDQWINGQNVGPNINPSNTNEVIG